MNNVSNVLGNAGAPVVATLSDGRELVVHRFTQAHKTRIEQHLIAGLKAQFLADREGFTDEEFQLAYKAFMSLAGSGDYKFGGAAYVKFLNGGSGGVYLMRLLCRWGDGKELTDNDLIAIGMNPADTETLKVSVSQALAESFPKAPAPASAPGTSVPETPLPL